MANNNTQVKVLFSSDDPGVLGMRFNCSSFDITSSSINITSNKQIMINSVLDLCVTLEGSNEEYHLTGDVKWCKQNTEKSNYGVGIQLKNRVGTPTDLNNWKQALTHAV